MKLLYLLILLSFGGVSRAQTVAYSGTLLRADGEAIPFRITRSGVGPNEKYAVHNGSEKIELINAQRVGDSVSIDFPVFESHLRFIGSPRGLSGYWYKAGAVRNIQMPFKAIPEKKNNVLEKSMSNFSGRWKVVFGDGPGEFSIGEFKQVQNKLEGTFLETGGDLRYLAGTVRGDSMFLSVFDGVHAIIFKGKTNKTAGKISGVRISAVAPPVSWTASKDGDATLDYSTVAMNVKPGNDRLGFRFIDVNGDSVGIADKRFQDKVVLVQLLGTWCPNCMDETAFLASFYARYKTRGVEIIGLAYEYSTDRERSLNNLKRLQKRFNVAYPLLWTGVSVADPHKTEKTLPEMTDIKTFPSMIVLNKKGGIYKVLSDFNGPATGAHYDEFKKQFMAMIDSLLAQN